MTDIGGMDGFDCDNANVLGGQIGGTATGVLFGGATTAAAIVAGSTPVTWAEAVPTAIAIDGAYQLGHEMGHQLGGPLAQAACEETNRFVDWLASPPAPVEEPALSPGLAGLFDSIFSGSTDTADSTVYLQDIQPDYGGDLQDYFPDYTPDTVYDMPSDSGGDSGGGGGGGGTGGGGSD